MQASMATGLLRRTLRLVIALALFSYTASLHAQSMPIGSDALPGGDHVHAATEPVVLAANGTLLYAHTGDVLREDDRHERVASTVAASLRVFRALSVAAAMDARADFHRGSASDTGLATSSTLIARARTTLFADRLHLGAELRTIFPAAQSVARGFDAITPEIRALGTYLQSVYALTLNVGARLDNSRRSVADPSRLSGADRLASQISEHDALLFGASVSRKLYGLTWLSELSYDLGVGRGAPNAAACPIRLELRAQSTAFDKFVWGTFIGVSPSIRPKPDLLTRVEPRVWFGINLGFLLDSPAPQAEPAMQTVPAPEPQAPPQPASDPALPAGQIRGQVRNLRGKALAADIEVQPLGIHVTTDEQGYFAIDVAPGDYRVIVSAPFHTPQTRAALVEQDGVTILVVDLARSER